MSFDLKPKNEETSLEKYEELSISYSEEIDYDVAYHQWVAPEHEPYTVGKNFYLFSTIFLSAVIIYALVSNSPIMAITFILIGIMGYIFLQKKPQMIKFSLTNDGVVAGNEIYEFDNLNSFWIYYEPPFEKMLSLKSKNKFTPFIHIPIGNEDPVKIRQILIDFIPEEKQEHTLVDTVEIFLHR